MQPDAEPGVERPVEHPLAVHLEDLRARRSPPSSASRTFAASTPERSASSERLGDRLDRRRDHELVAGLARPARRRSARRARCSSRAPRRSAPRAANASSAPPTMIESAASIAPRSPPLTGASSIATSLAANAAAIARVGLRIDRAHVDHERPGTRRRRARRRRRSAPASTSVVSGSIVIVTSLAAATAAGSSARGAPASTSSSTGPGAARVHREREPGREQVARHGLAHDAQPDEPDALAHAQRLHRRVGDLERPVDDLEPFARAAPRRCTAAGSSSRSTNG